MILRYFEIYHIILYLTIVLNQIKLNYSVFSMFKYHIKRTILYITLCLIVCIMLNMYTLNIRYMINIQYIDNSIILLHLVKI